MGGKDYINHCNYQGSQMLFQHQREKREKYIERIKRSYYLNYCKFVIDTYAKFIFSGKNDIIRTTEPENSMVFEPYIENIDGKNTEIDRYMQLCFVNALIYGEYYILIDKPSRTDENMSIFDAENSNFRAYTKRIPPTMILDYSKDDFGNYNWILIKEICNDDLNPLYYSEEIYNYRLITKDQITLYYSDGMIQPGYPIDNELGIVPIIKMVVTDVDDNGVGESLLKDIALINRDIYNTCSLRSEELYNVAFPQLYGPPQKPKDKGVRQDTIETGVGQYWQIPNKDSVMPGYLSPDTSTITYKDQNINMMILEVMRLAGLQKDDAVMSSSDMSGISKAISFLDTNESFADKAKKLQNIEGKIWFLIKKYDLINDNIQVDYPHEFDILSKTEKLRIGMDLQSISDSQTANNIMFLNLMEDNFPLTDDQYNEIKKEIEENDTDENIDQSEIPQTIPTEITRNAIPNVEITSDESMTTMQ